MALKGTQSKAIVTQKILEVFEGSFQYDKEIRIPLMEDGNEIQLKCVLTCAKTNVTPNGDEAIPGAVNNEINFADNTDTVKETIHVEPTEEEKANVKKLMEQLGL